MGSVPVRGILLDFDGVLVDSEPIRFRAGAEALAEIGVPLTWERFLTDWLGRTDEAGLAHILGERFRAEVKRVVECRNVLYEEHLDEVPPFADAVRLLGRLHNGIRLALATGSRRMEVEQILARLGLLPRFHALVTAEDYRHAKPAPEPFLIAARRMDLPPAACLVVEDSPAGMLAAQAAGMLVLGVDRGRVATRLLQATWIVGSLDALTVTAEGDIIVNSATGRMEA